MIGVNRERLQSLPRERLVAECLKVSRAWERKGRPDLDDMPAELRGRYLALKAEMDRRGQQLRLF